MINWHPYCPANTRPDICPAPQFPFLEPEDQSNALLSPSTSATEPNPWATGLGLLFLQQPQMWTSIAQNLTQQASQKLSQVWENLFKPKKEPKTGAVLIEACRDANNPTWHGKAVQDVFQKTLTRYKQPAMSPKQPVKIICVNKDALLHIRSPKDYLDQLLDLQFTRFLADINKTITKLTNEGHNDVISISAGGDRTLSYLDIQKALSIKPDDLAPLLGLKATDIRKLQSQLQQKKRPDPELFNKVNAAIVRYVNQHLDHPASAYHQFKAQYQQVVREAAKKGVAVVVSTGNSQQNTNSFNTALPGATTNFLLEADEVIGVGASDDKRTPSTDDDTVAPFSSWGNGVHNPTVLAPGVKVRTSNGLFDGSSASAPHVAAVIRIMKTVNPELEVQEIKDILQETATDIMPDTEIADGAGAINPKSAIQEAERRGKWFSFS